MATLPSMGLETPAVSGDRGIWGGKVNANFTKIDAHTHIAGQGEQVPVDGILIDDDLSFNSTFGCTDLHAITFASIVALTDNAFNKSLFVANGSGGLVNGELYWRNTSGNHVQLTDGNTLNVSAFVGGIGGDYNSVGALLDYDDSTKTYRLRQQIGSSVRQFARASTGGVRLFEFKASPASGVPTTSVLLSSPAALASSYTVTFPAALPSSLQLMAIDATGQMAFAATGGVGPITLAENQSVTVSGTGSYKHGNLILSLSPQLAFVAQGTPTETLSRINFGSDARITLGIPLKVGDRIKSYTVSIFGDNAVDIACEFIQISATGVDTIINTTTITNAPNAWVTTTINQTDQTIADGEFYVITYRATGVSTLVAFGATMITYDRP